MFEAYGIRVSSEHDIVYIFRLLEFVIASKFDLLHIYFSQLPLLKTLIDRLLQEGIEELLHVLGTSKKIKENAEKHTSNVIAEYTVRKTLGEKWAMVVCVGCVYECYQMNN